MSTYKNLILHTNDFFDKHWRSSESNPRPKWTALHSNFTNKYENFDKQGCYAFFHNDDLIYIGLGIRSGKGIYKNRGLSSRTNTYFPVKPVSKPLNKIAIKTTAMTTIGFLPDDAYLAAALEVFLIKKLQPEMNDIYK